MTHKYNRLTLLVILITTMSKLAFATGEPSTYFNIFVPPNNDAVHRDVCLVVTAIFDSTSFTITDDAMDGDSDDTKTGLLMAGQSYILYIRDNGINDDAAGASGGVLKQDGDYFIITSSNNVYASQSTNSDWQHDWMPGISQSSLSQKFILYAPKVSSSKRDFNAFAYEDSTFVTLRKISLTPTTISGYTNVDYTGGTVIFQKMINRGQDLIHFYTNARDILDDGCTYVIESSKPVTIQYGALYGNERDGGGYVPTDTGSSSGSLAYFCVPYQATGEQEIRIVSWDASNSVQLYRYNAGAWVLLKNWSMGQKTIQEWVGKSNGNVSYPTVFKIVCTPGKRVSIFEGNWFETGSPGTSDMATMMSAENGTCSGTYFLAYMAPPGNETNVKNPFTNTAFGGNYTHLYIFSQDTAHVVVKDNYTGGVDFSRTYSILPGRYVDCALNTAQWKSIYNGTGTTAGGPERPYLDVTSDKPISVMNTNFNDNWMMYFGSSQFRSFSQNSSSSSSVVSPGQTLTVTSDVVIQGNLPITSVTAEVQVEGGLKVISSTFVDVTNNQNYNGQISTSSIATIINFNNLPNLSPQNQYKIVTVAKGQVGDVSGTPISNNSVSEITTIVNGVVNGISQQSISLESVALNSLNTSSLIFSYPQNTGLENTLTDSWTVSTIDYDNDGDDDLFFTDATSNQPNKLYRNNGHAIFTPVTSGALVTDQAKSMSSSWADADNDGDLDVIVANNTLKSCYYYTNSPNGTLTRDNSPGFTQNLGFYHHASWVDVDNDGQVELYLGNYWPTRLNELWKRDANGHWNLWADNLLSQINGSGPGSTWADYDNDGSQDLLILNNEEGTNRMYHNLGNGHFEIAQNEITSKGGHSVGSVWGDIDNDGDLDLFVSNASNIDNDLFINEGNGHFSSITSSPAVHDRGHSHGASLVDIDKDSDLDLFVANDQGVKFLYLNDGIGNFSAKTDEWPNTNFAKSYGSSFSDLDMDGDLDLVCATHGNQRDYIFTANNNSNHWLSIRLVGTNSNRSAIGSRIKIKSNGKWQIREVNSQTGFGGQSSYRQHFGTGNASTIDSLIIMWPSGYNQIQTAISANQNLVITEENGARLTGFAYFDANNNCHFDSNELPLNNVSLSLNNGAQICYTNQNGQLSSHLEVGQYTVQLASPGFSTSCPIVSQFSIASIGNNFDLGNIALRSTCESTDLEVATSSGIMRRGFHNEYNIAVKNNGIQSATGTVLTVSLPTSLTLDLITPMWSTSTIQNGRNTLTWNLGTLGYNDKTFVKIGFVVSNQTPLNQTLICNFEVHGLETDCKSSNNSRTDYQNVFGSNDPNDMSVYPKGENDQGCVDNSQVMTYRIRFQNVGNFEAEFVNILDVLPDGLDPNSIHNIISSHDYLITTKGRELRIYYPQIQLPDSSSNQAESNGFFQFSILQKVGNTSGVVLENMASIQFDYNEPIATNSVINNVCSNEISREIGTLIIFPNPTSEYATLKAKVQFGNSPELNLVSVYRQDGALVLRDYFKSNQPQIDFQTLPAGIYLLFAIDSKGKSYSGNLIVQH